MEVSGNLEHDEVVEPQELPSGQEVRKPTREEMEDIIQRYGWIMGDEWVAQIRSRYTQ